MPFGNIVKKKEFTQNHSHALEAIYVRIVEVFPSVNYLYGSFIHLQNCRLSESVSAMRTPTVRWQTSVSDRLTYKDISETLAVRTLANFVLYSFSSFWSKDSLQTRDTYEVCAQEKMCRHQLLAQ